MRVRYRRGYLRLDRRKNGGPKPTMWLSREAWERISTSTADSKVNQVISKKIVKKQKMRWSRRGAHLLLRGRASSNGEFRSTFNP